MSSQNEFSDQVCEQEIGNEDEDNIHQYYSTVTEMNFCPSLVIKKYTIELDNRKFLNARLLDDLSGQPIDEKFRKLKPLVECILLGTSIRRDDVLKTISWLGRKTVVLAFGVMNLVVIRGFNQLPWTDMRRKYISYVFPNSPELIPDYNTYQTSIVDEQPIPASENIPSSEHLHPNFTFPTVPENADLKSMEEICKGFWNDVIAFMNKHQFSLDFLVEKLTNDAIKRKKNRTKRKQDTNHLYNLSKCLFKKPREDIEDSLFLAIKTGNWNDILHAVRDYLYLPGLGQAQIIPAPNSIRMKSRPLISDFINLFKPERTYSGFRIDLVQSVKIVCYLLLGERTDMKGLRVDIWGDGVEIGKKEQTRLAFRILSSKISAQSSDSVFTFGVFQGK